MRVLLITITILLVGVFHCTNVVQSQQPNERRDREDQTRKELELVLASRDAAAESNEIERLLAFYAPELQIRVGDRILTRHDVEQIMRLSIPAEIIEFKQRSVINSLKVQGDQAYLSAETNQLLKQRLQNGSIKETRSTSEQRETWLMSRHGWRLRAVDNLKTKESTTTIDGKKVDPLTAPTNFLPVVPEPREQAILQSGHGLVFIYRPKDGTIVKTAIFCSDAKLAEMTGGSFVKVKLIPGQYSFRSEKGSAIDLKVESGKLYFLSVRLEAGFPKARGVLEPDPISNARLAYKLPQLLEVRPLGSDNIYDTSRVIVERP